MPATQSEIAMHEKTVAPATVYLRNYKIPSYLIDEVNLYFDLNEHETIVISHLLIRHNRLSTEKSNILILNGEELELISIHIDEQELSPSDYELTDQYLIIPNAPDNFELKIKVRIYPQKNTALSGLYRSANTYCTQCEAEGFRRITYYLDHPDILARFTTTIVADSAQYPVLLSNGNLIDAGQLENGKHWVKWEDPFKKPSYLFALVAGNLDMVEDHFVTQSGRDILLRIYVDKGFSDQTQHAMHSLKEAMRWDEEAYGREYDLDIYMIVAIGDFNMGAMENKGLNIFNTKYILAKPETATDDDYIHILSVIGHEYFHNWSGNRVTCRDWFQLSLKEGLTIFRDQSFTEDTLSRAVMRIRDVNMLREIQFPEDAGPLAHPVRPDSYIEINNFYTATVYNKGAEVLRMLQTILGKAQFRKGMDLYFARHDGQAVTIEDYVKTMEDVSGIDLTQFRLWYSQAGTPVVTVQQDYNEQAKTYTLTFTQHCPPTPGQASKKPFFIPIRMALLDQQGNEMPLHLEGSSVETEKVLNLVNTSQVFAFTNVTSLPIPSLLRNFSAPVILNFPYRDDELRFLFKHDKDSFSRWEAGQKYLLQIMLRLIQDYQLGKSLSLPRELAELFDYILQHDIQDKFLLAEMLVLPSEKYIGEQMPVVEVDAIHEVREFMLVELAQQLESLFLQTYKNNHQMESTYEFTIDKIGKRQLKNRCLLYLSSLESHASLAMEQFESALKSNMTDTMPALIGLCNLEHTYREDALHQFYETWQHDPLVVDKWLAVQAATKLPRALQDVKRLLRHPAFDIKNPNKVYSLIGTFGRNAVNFHNINGEGYAFLREMVHELDKLNPQISARMVKPLTSWKRYDKERQALMRQQLELLLQDKTISTDLYELVTKSLE